VTHGHRKYHCKKYLSALFTFQGTRPNAIDQEDIIFLSIYLFVFPETKMKIFDTKQKRFYKNNIPRQKTHADKNRSKFRQELAAVEHLYSSDRFPGSI
jgi:hypothetical protein